MKKYWEFWLDERERSIRMSYVVLVLVSVIFILTYALYKIYATPKPIYVISPNQQTGIVVPNKYNKFVVKDFVKHYLTLTNTYTPSTVKENLSEASYYIVPKLYASTKYDFENTINSSIQQNMSSAIFINDKSMKVQKKAKGVWEVTLNAQINIYFGTSLIKKNVKFNITVKRGNPTDKNPYGLYLYSLKESEV